MMIPTRANAHHHYGAPPPPASHAPPTQFGAGAFVESRYARSVPTYNGRPDRRKWKVAAAAASAGMNATTPTSE